jgi:hypothetical protein
MVKTEKFNPGLAKLLAREIRIHCGLKCVMPPASV